MITKSPTIEQLRTCRFLIIIIDNSTNSGSLVAFIDNGLMQAVYDINGVKDVVSVRWNKDEGTITYDKQECSTYGVCMLF